MKTNMTKDQISIGVRKFIMENYLYGYDENELSNDSSFMQLGVLDSTGVIELVALLEREYSIEVADSEIIPENLDSIYCIGRYVFSKLNSHTEEQCYEGL